MIKWPLEFLKQFGLPDETSVFLSQIGLPEFVLEIGGEFGVGGDERPLCIGAIGGYPIIVESSSGIVRLESENGGDELLASSVEKLGGLIRVIQDQGVAQKTDIETLTHMLQEIDPRGFAESSVWKSLLEDWEAMDF